MLVHITHALMWEDQTWASLDGVMISHITANLALICACAAFFRPLTGLGYSSAYAMQPAPSRDGRDGKHWVGLVSLSVLLEGPRRRAEAQDLEIASPCQSATARRSQSALAHDSSMDGGPHGSEVTSVSVASKGPHQKSPSAANEIHKTVEVEVFEEEGGGPLYKSSCKA